MVSHAKLFERCMISVNRLATRKSDFSANCWILDSGAFTRITLHGEHWPIEWYVNQISRWSRCGTLEAAVTQDWMCEPFVVAKTGLSVAEHQRLTIERFDSLIQQMKSKRVHVYLLPVLQGRSSLDYAKHVLDYGDRLRLNDWCGVGSVCKRNGSPHQVLEILRAILDVRPDLRLHGFGLKHTALMNCQIRHLLYSADSMAWSYAARREGRDANSAFEALAYCQRMDVETATPLFDSVFDKGGAA